MTDDEFNIMVRTIAIEDGADYLLDIPGIWVIVSEHYNNEAIDRVNNERE